MRCFLVVLFLCCLIGCGKSQEDKIKEEAEKIKVHQAAEARVQKEEEETNRIKMDAEMKADRAKMKSDVKKAKDKVEQEIRQLEGKK